MSSWSETWQEGEQESGLLFLIACGDGRAGTRSEQEQNRGFLSKTNFPKSLEKRLYSTPFLR